MMILEELPKKVGSAFTLTQRDFLATTYSIKRSSIMRREKILEFLKQYKLEKGQNYTINRIGIFGSAARDEMASESDVDIVVELEQADLFYLVRIKNDLKEIFKRDVDIIRYNSKMNPFLKKRIDKEAYYVSSDPSDKKL